MKKFFQIMTITIGLLVFPQLSYSSDSSDCNAQYNWCVAECSVIGIGACSAGFAWWWPDAALTCSIITPVSCHECCVRATDTCKKTGKKIEHASCLAIGIGFTF